jgi:hypothetical protein
MDPSYSWKTKIVPGQMLIPTANHGKGPALCAFAVRDHEKREGRSPPF